MVKTQDLRYPSASSLPHPFMFLTGACLTVLFALKSNGSVTTCNLGLTQGLSLLVKQTRVREEASPRMLRRRGTGLALRSNPPHVDCLGSCHSLLFPLLGEDSTLKLSTECTSTLYSTPLSSVLTWFALLTLLWTRMPELDVADVGRFFSVPRSLRASPNHVDFRELQLSNRRLEGCSDSCSLEAGYQNPLVCCLHCFSILHSLPGPQWGVGDGYPAFQQTGAQRTQGKGTRRLLRVRTDLHGILCSFRSCQD